MQIIEVVESPPVLTIKP
jgi:hypothetical protein